MSRKFLVVDTACRGTSVVLAESKYAKSGMWSKTPKSCFMSNSAVMVSIHDMSDFNTMLYIGRIDCSDC